MNYTASLKEIIKHTDILKKIESQFFISSKYHATTSRLKLSLNYLEEAKLKFDKKDVFAYKALLEMALITYSACFNNSKLLLKESHIPLNEILTKDDLLKNTDRKVKYIRDKILAHQDKVDELNYDINVIFTDDKVTEFNFPFLTKLDFNMNDITNFKNLIIKVHNYLDIKRKKHDDKLLIEIKKIDNSQNILKLCQDNNII